MSQYAEQLQSSIAEWNITGASFAYWDGTELHSAVAGLRNSVTRDPVTVDTVMHIGSITKVLNAVLLMQLVDDGEVALEDPVTKYLPELRLRQRTALEHITCEMLLNHTSGINGDWLPEYGPDQERILDAVERCADLDQLFAPGEATSYCNIATVIAGYLTQKLRAMSWYTLVKRRIFEPLGMRRSLADVIEGPRFRCSVGDLTDLTTGRPMQTTRPFLSPSFAPAGSTLMTSAGDLVALARALLNGGLGLNGVRIVSSASAARMGRAATAFLSPAYQMGLGWMIAPGGVLMHSGVGPGVYSILFADPVSGRAVALLTNCDRGGVLRPEIVDPIIESWTGIEKTTPVSHNRVTDLTPYEGAYESNLQRIEVFSPNAGLAMRLSLKMKLYDNSPYGPAANTRPPSILFPVGDHAFEAEPVLPRGPKIELKFSQPDSTGRMRFLGTGFRLLRRI